MRIRIHPHAHKHGLTKKQIVEAYDSGQTSARIRGRDQDTDPQRWATIGFDSSARAIELVFVRESDAVLVFHARYLTEGFRRELTNEIYRRYR